MVDATEQPDFVSRSNYRHVIANRQDALVHIKAVGALCATEPGLIDTSKASVLLSYLHSAANVSETSSPKVACAD